MLEELETLTGTEVKVAIRMACSGLTMDDYDFECDFFTSVNKVVKVKKVEMAREAEDCYIAVVDTTDMAGGRMKIRATAYIPDGDCKDGLRTEIGLYDTDIMLKRNFLER